jgi:hypothetical protein
VYAALGGVEVGPYSRTFDEKEREEHYRMFRENESKFGLAKLTLDYLRLEEALGRPPTPKEIGTSEFKYRGAEEAGLGSGLEGAWVQYEQVVREALASKLPKRQA